jgi:hypothetical protein
MRVVASAIAKSRRSRIVDSSGPGSAGRVEVTCHPLDLDVESETKL